VTEMASYIAHNARRDTVALMLSRAEAEALLKLASRPDGEEPQMNGKTRASADRATSALSASINPTARRAGFFDD